MSHVYEVSAFNSKLSKALLRPAEWLDRFDNWLFIVKVLNSRRVHFKLHRDRERYKAR
jgi:hypothetical protein